ncbi:hypothetical protein [Methanobrevibacter sp.]|uniref:hypothetical protein n=1 Tax=Methanobrevibacter sp. TaxID=66852 RepID=UPI00386738E4
MVGAIAVAILFLIVVAACCSSDSSSNGGTTKRNVSNQNRSTANQYNYPAYCECPSCGAPYYDGYCEECGYPDINQGWIGENY